jgi:hypothetical protein
MPKQSIPIELGGKTRHLRYTFNSLCRLEEETGIPIGDIGNFKSGSLRLTTLRALIWAGLVHDDKDLTPEAVGEIFEDMDLGTIADKIGEAFEAAFPEIDEELKKKSIQKRPS